MSMYQPSQESEEDEVNILEQEQFGVGQDEFQSAEAKKDVSKFRNGFGQWLVQSQGEKVGKTFLTLFDIYWSLVSEAGKGKSRGEAEQTHREKRREDTDPWMVQRGDLEEDWKAQTGLSFGSLKDYLGRLPQLMEQYITTHADELGDEDIFVDLMNRIRTQREKARPAKAMASVGSLHLAEAEDERPPDDVPDYYDFPKNWKEEETEETHDKKADMSRPNMKHDITPELAQQILDSVRPGDMVTIMVPAGMGREGQEWKEASGKIVMRSSHGGWVLNMGGKHGTPGVADVNNIVGIFRRAKRTSLEKIAQQLVAVPELTPEMRKQVERAFIYRWTHENPKRTQVYHCDKCDVKNPYVNTQSAEGHQHPTIPLISDEQWIREHAFYFTNDGRLFNRGEYAHAQPVYLAQHNANRFASVDLKFAIEKAAYSPDEFKTEEEKAEWLLANGWAKENGHHGATWWMGKQMWYKPDYEESIPYQDTDDAYEKEIDMQFADGRLPDEGTCKDCGAALNNAEGNYCGACAVNHVDEDAGQFEKESMIGHMFNDADGQAIRNDTAEDTGKDPQAFDTNEYRQPRMAADEEYVTDDERQAQEEAELAQNAEPEQSVAQTILEQLGGRKFSVMTGAKNFSGGPQSLSFRLPGGGGYTKNSINAVMIRLESNDTYTVTYYRIRGTKMTTVSEHRDIYAENLRENFERETGLRTSLGGGGLFASKEAAGSNSGEDDERGAGDVWREFYYSRYEGLPADALMSGMKESAEREKGQLACCGGWHNQHKPNCSVYDENFNKTVDSLKSLGKRSAEANPENWQCLDCGHEGMMTTAGNCEACGSQAVSPMVPDAPARGEHLLHERISQEPIHAADDKTAQATSGAGATTINMQEQNATVPATPGKGQPMAVPDNIDQQAGPHSPNAPGTAPRTPTIQPRIVNVPAGTVGEDTMSVQSSEDADWESMHPEEHQGEEFPDVSCERCHGDNTEVDELPDGGYQIYCEDCNGITSVHPAENDPQHEFSDDENRRFTDYMKSLGASKKFASLPGAGQMIGDWRVVLAEDWYIYMVDQQGKMWFYDTEVWPKWEKVPNAWGQDTLSEQPTVEAMIPYAEMHEPKPVMSDDRRTQMTLEQFMNNVKDEDEMVKQGAGEQRQGTVDKISLTNSGYQMTTIDGVTYATLFDWAELPVKEGSVVNYIVGENVPGWKDTPFAKITEVKQAPPAEKMGAAAPAANVNPNVAQQQALHNQQQMNTALPQQNGVSVALMPGQQQDDGGSSGYGGEEPMKRSIQPELDQSEFLMREGSLQVGAYEAPIDLVASEMQKLGGLNTFKITFEDGNTITTDFNGSLEDAEAYYLNNYFNFGDTDEHPTDNLQKGVSVEQVGEDPDARVNEYLRDMAARGFVPVPETVEALRQRK